MDRYYVMTKCFVVGLFWRNSKSSISYSYHHHISVMELGHLLTRSGLTYPEVSSKVCHDSFCQLGNSVSLPWVIYYGAYSRYTVKGNSGYLHKNKILIKFNNKLSKSVEINKGVRQGCPLSPKLFNIYLDEIITKWQKQDKTEIKLSKKTSNCQRCYLQTTKS